jgi:hypothetical protein
MPYRYSPKPPQVADLRQSTATNEDAAVEPPPAETVAEAPESAQDVLDESLEEPPEPPKRKRGRPRKNPDA